MSRTSDQIEADRLLEEAIEGVARAYDYVDPGEIITAWVVVGSSLGFADGDQEDNFFVLNPEQGQSPFQAIGLLRYGQLAVERDTVDNMYLRNFDDDESDEDLDG